METKLDRILKFHEGDDKQIEIIRTDKNRVIVEAPAGYGKTKTMMS